VLVAHINTNCYCGVEVRSCYWASNQHYSENCECDSELAEWESERHVNRVEQKGCAHEFVEEHNQFVVFGRVNFHYLNNLSFTF
jgi:hypothetical protein